MNYTMLKNAALLSVATVGGVLSALMGGWDALLKALLICMAVDYITGLAVAACGKSPKSASGRITSNAAVAGIIKKGVELLVILVAAQLQAVAGGAGIRDTAVLFFLGSEGISIVENGGLLGVPLPRGLKRWFEVLRDENDRKGDGDGTAGD